MECTAINKGEAKAEIAREIRACASFHPAFERKFSRHKLPPPFGKERSAALRRLRDGRNTPALIDLLMTSIEACAHEVWQFEQPSVAAERAALDQASKFCTRNAGLIQKLATERGITLADAVRAVTDAVRKGALGDLRQLQRRDGALKQLRAATASGTHSDRKATQLNPSFTPITYAELQSALNRMMGAIELPTDERDALAPDIEAEVNELTTREWRQVSGYRSPSMPGTATPYGFDEEFQDGYQGAANGQSSGMLLEESTTINFRYDSEERISLKIRAAAAWEEYKPVFDKSTQTMKGRSNGDQVDTRTSGAPDLGCVA